MSDAARKYRFVPLVALLVVVLLAGGGVFWMVRGFLNSAPQPAKQVVQEIHVIRPPPPPPDEPPPPPPPPEEKVDVHEPDPEPDPTPSNEPPPSEQLGLDAEGGAGGDAFGLAGHPGGRELLASGGSALNWYGGLVKNEIVEKMDQIKEARKGSYSVSFDVWVRSDGTLERLHLVKTSGDAARDKAIENDLPSLIGRFPEPPPAGMPNPIRIRVSNRA